MTPERLRHLEALRDEAGRILDLLTEARARWVLLRADEQEYEGTHAENTRDYWIRRDPRPLPAAVHA